MGRVLMLAVALALGGCATVVRGTTEQLAFDSTPPGATMRIEFPPACPDGNCSGPTTGEGSATYGAVDTAALNRTTPGPACVTPCVMTMKRNQKLIATFSKDGYHPEVVTISPSTSGGGGAAVAGNVLLLGGVTGLLVDSATGAGFDLQPNPATVVLRPIVPAAPPPQAKPAARRR